MTNGTIILTGGAGFIGHHLLAQLNTLGVSNIIVVDNLNHPLKKQYLSQCKYVQYYDKSIFLHVLPALTNISAILHQGACSATTETNETYLQQNNVDYSVALLQYSIQHNIPFIYASSAAVYGNGALGFSDAINAYQPINGYAASKLRFDVYVTNLLQSTNPPINLIVGLRYFNVYGPGEAHKGFMSSVVGKFYQQYIHNSTIQLFEGSETIKRDFIYVSDVVDTVLFFLQSSNVASGIYNVGTGLAQSFTALASAFTQVYPNTVIETIPFPAQLKHKYQYYTQANISKLLALGHNPTFTSLCSGVHQYIHSITQHEPA